MMRVSVVANPRAGSGAAAHKLAALERGLRERGIEHEILRTERKGHAVELARQAARSGATVLLVVGGDGTLNEVSQSYLDAEGAVASGPALALLSAGTGGDFSRSAAPGNSEVPGLLRRLEAMKLCRLDLGVICLTQPSGQPLHRAFVNVASFGLAGEVDERVERGPKWLGGKAAFMLATVSATLVYRNVPLEISIDGQVWHRGPLALGAIANGQYFGGGMHIAPQADFSDGCLDVVCVGDIGKAKFLSLFPSVYRGAHLRLDCVKSARGKEIAVRPLREQKPILVDVDGETPGYLPLSARVVPGALQFLID